MTGMPEEGSLRSVRLVNAMKGSLKCVLALEQSQQC